MSLQIFRLAGNSPALSKEQQRALLFTRSNESVKFYLFPTAHMVQEIIKGQSAILSQLPAQVVEVFANADGILFDQKIIVDRANDALDKRNAFLLDSCNIKFTGVLPECLKGLHK